MPHQTLATAQATLRLGWPIRMLSGCLMVIYAPLALIAAIFLLPLICAIGVFATAHAYRAGRLDSKRLRRSLSTERVSSWTELQAHPTDTPVTIIIDERTIGWNVVNVWWSSEDYRRHDGPPPPGDLSQWRPTSVDEIGSHPFMEWCERLYTNPVSGRARLLDCLFTYSDRKRLERRLSDLASSRPNLSRVTLWSGMLEEVRRDRAAENRSDNMAGKALHEPPESAA